MGVGGGGGGGAGGRVGEELCSWNGPVAGDEYVA